MSVRFQVMIPLFRAFLATLMMSAVAVPVASAQSDEKPARKKPEAKKPETKKPASKETSTGSGAPAGATLVATFGDWGAYTAQSGKAKICYALSEPKGRTPTSLKDTKAYLFVSFRPADSVRNELASVLNFKTKEGGAASLGIGSTSFDLVTRGENAWIKTQADEANAIGAMGKGGAVIVQATSVRGNKTSDRYSLTGFSQALERAKRDCP